MPQPPDREPFFGRSGLLRETVVFALLLIGATAGAADFWVAPGGSDVAPGSCSQPFKTNQRATDVMQAGDGLLAQEAEQKSRQVLRGTPMVLGKSLGASVAFAMDVKNWQQVKDLGLNTVRVCWVDPWFADRKRAHWTAEEVLPKLDACVTNARATGLNIIINYHNVGEQQEQVKAGKPLDFSRLAGFWRLVASRYKDQAHVFYELSNEPSFDGGTYLKPEFRMGLLGVYRQVRQDAPQRMILLFSFNSLDSDLKGIVDAYASEIDWEHTMVAFHFYGGDGTSRRARALAKAYPSICTEWDYPGAADYVKQVDGKLLIPETCENVGVGWIDWRSWSDTKLDRIRGTLIPDAKAKGYWWGKN